MAIGDGAFEGVGFHMNIGIGKQQPLAAASAHTAMQGVHLAQPPRRQFGNMDSFNSGVFGRQLVDDGAGGVGGTVINHDNFEMGIILPGHFPAGGFNVFFFVAGGNHQRHAGPDGGFPGIELCQSRHEPICLNGAKRHPEPIGYGGHGVDQQYNQPDGHYNAFNQIRSGAIKSS